MKWIRNLFQKPSTKIAKNIKPLPDIEKAIKNKFGNAEYTEDDYDDDLAIIEKVVTRMFREHPPICKEENFKEKHEEDSRKDIDNIKNRQFQDSFSIQTEYGGKLTIRLEKKIDQYPIPLQKIYQASNRPLKVFMPSNTHEILGRKQQS